jgi:hypothetical protein
MNGVIYNLSPSRLVLRFILSIFGTVPTVITVLNRIKKILRDDPVNSQ